MKSIYLYLLFSLCSSLPYAIYAKHPCAYMANIFVPLLRETQATNRAFTECLAALSAQKNNEIKIRNAGRLRNEYQKTCDALEKLIKNSKEQTQKKLSYALLLQTAGINMLSLDDNLALLGAILVLPTGILALNAGLKIFFQNRALLELNKQNWVNMQTLESLTAAKK